MYFPVCLPLFSISSTAILTLVKFLLRLDFWCQPHYGFAQKVVFLSQWKDFFPGPHLAFWNP